MVNIYNVSEGRLLLDDLRDELYYYQFESPTPYNKAECIRELIQNEFMCTSCNGLLRLSNYE